MPGLWGNQIRNCLINCQNFCGVFASDTYTPREGAAIINTAPYRSSGEHWVCLIIEGNQAIYFDSYGLPPWDTLARQLLGYRVSFNGFKFQTSELPACGHYCVLVIKHFTNMLQLMDTFYMLGDAGVMSLVGVCGARRGQTCKGVSCNKHE